MTGPPASGKSSLAAEMMSTGGHLVADDAVLVARRGDRLRAAALNGAGQAPGLIELRGSGIFSCVNASATPLHYGVRLVPVGQADRLPDDASIELLGIALPTITLVAAGAPTAPRLLLAASARRVA